MIGFIVGVFVGSLVTFSTLCLIRMGKDDM